MVADNNRERNNVFTQGLKMCMENTGMDEDDSTLVFNGIVVTTFV